MHQPSYGTKISGRHEKTPWVDMSGLRHILRQKPARTGSGLLISVHFAPALPLLAALCFLSALFSHLSAPSKAGDCHEISLPHRHH
jgi:hypothetical protein